MRISTHFQKFTCTVEFDYDNDQDKIKLEKLCKADTTQDFWDKLNDIGLLETLERLGMDGTWSAVFWFNGEEAKNETAIEFNKLIEEYTK